MVNSLPDEREDQIRETQLKSRLEWVEGIHPQDYPRRAEKGSCPGCGEIFAESRRVWPSVGIGWGGELSDYYSEGLCPKCYRQFKNDEYAWSTDEWKAYVLVKIARIRMFANTSFECYTDGTPDERHLCWMHEEVSNAEVLLSQARKHCPDCADVAEECLSYVSQLPMEAQSIMGARKTRNRTIAIVAIALLVIGVCAVVLLVKQ